ncbi:MAG: hypothetical protein JSV96_09040, partial [Candidatus Aminicenantes bacterium]
LYRLTALKLPGPYTQRICVDRYWSVTNAETERINHSATIKVAFYTQKQRQSIIFSLNPVVKTASPRRKSRSQLKLEAIERARLWKALIGTDGIETQADLARYLGVSRARVTQVLRRLT